MLFVYESILIYSLWLLIYLRWMSFHLSTPTQKNYVYSFKFLCDIGGVAGKCMLLRGGKKYLIFNYTNIYSNTLI